MAMGTLVLFSLSLKAQQMENINNVITRMFVATDQRDWAEVSRSFASEVIIDYSSMTGSPATTSTPGEIVSNWKKILPGFKSTHHQLGNFLTTVEGQKARVFCYGTAGHYLPDEKGDVWTVTGTYDFELSKDPMGNWKITQMKFNFKYQSGNTSLPEKAMSLAAE